MGSYNVFVSPPGTSINRRSEITRVVLRSLFDGETLSLAFNELGNCDYFKEMVHWFGTLHLCHCVGVICHVKTITDSKEKLHDSLVIQVAFHKILTYLTLEHILMCICLLGGVRKFVFKGQLTVEEVEMKNGFEESSTFSKFDIHRESTCRLCYFVVKPTEMNSFVGSIKEIIFPGV
ncbi:hypothetical protein L2E82_50389 [Cichorium intybus]|nr:hypothetical protein L2E82_50389 [Cichorium intybus]